MNDCGQFKGQPAALCNAASFDACDTHIESSFLATYPKRMFFFSRCIQNKCATVNSTYLHIQNSYP